MPSSTTQLDHLRYTQQHFCISLFLEGEGILQLFTVVEKYILILSLGVRKTIDHNYILQTRPLSSNLKIFLMLLWPYAKEKTTSLSWKQDTMLSPMSKLSKCQNITN